MLMSKMCPLESVIIKAEVNSVKCFELLNEFVSNKLSPSFHLFSPDSLTIPNVHRMQTPGFHVLWERAAFYFQLHKLFDMPVNSSSQESMRTSCSIADQLQPNTAWILTISVKQQDHYFNRYE